jgi:hypothetical protein
MESLSCPLCNPDVSDPLLPSLELRVTAGPVPTHHQAPLCRDCASGLWGRSKTSPVKRSDKTRASHGLWLFPDSGWKVRFTGSPRVRYPCPDLDPPWEHNSLPPWTVSPIAAFPERCSRPFDRRPCHCEHRATPTGTCAVRRLRCGRHLAPNHKPSSGAIQPPAAAAGHAALPQSNAKPAHTPQRLTQPCLVEALFTWVFSLPLRTLAPWSHPRQSRLLLALVPPPALFVCGADALPLIRTTDSARNCSTAPEY